MKPKTQKKLKLFLMILPFMVLVFCMYYVPLFGWVYAFTDYKPGKKFASLSFIGLQSFGLIFKDGGNFFNALKNTLCYSSLALLVQPLPMFPVRSGVTRRFRAVQSVKASSPIERTVSGTSSSVRPVQPRNAFVPMVCTESGIMMLLRPVQPWKALSPISVTESGSVILLSPVQP